MAGEAYIAGNKYIKAKSELAIIIISFPAVLFFALSTIYDDHKFSNTQEAFIIGLIVYIFVLMRATYGTIKCKPQNTI